ncbi:hypothetical protein OU748_001101 [Yersinia enterocolitica]|jgi:hypothetical protein|uniref:hypothetical protein n=1 Tax=Yersinia enterocolitica TaxID=630 RepID=UPI0003D8CE56|nr:hypothetical protein [Yersinia enterocolitica]EKN3753894.1 hypothetical protein [Yersinia enterocolitica]EKN3794802.1 hypothetical protein [Yersinia enterocolitica]EKN3876003.1 hypothetical protein [Yersinia enterocolitica]EKN4173531.1 hypothetical protein [Yersinia enterocolitica]EKN5977976.1 hypothetical protein [Yersinia enterocolitica]
MLRFNPNIPFEAANFFSQKNLDELNVHELSYIHLNTLHGHASLKTTYVYSSLYSLKENLFSSFNNIRTKNYTPLFTAFSMLEQIGNMYTPSQKTSNKTNGIKRALELFGNVTKHDINSLVMLRNGLYHNGSLVSKKEYNNQTDVIYRLSSSGGVLITPPKIQWDGIFRDNLADYLSIVDTVTLKNEVINVCDNAFSLLEKNNLNISLQDAREFYFKYLFSQAK